MKKIVVQHIKRLGYSERGFTLVELLVVVAIVVALAAATTVSVVQFAGKGETGAQSAEIQAVQSAMDTMMADVTVIVITGTAGSGTSTNDFTAVPVEGALGSYLRDNPTRYFYCWDNAGKIQQQLASGACPAGPY
ncbi:MAG: prepilin-type N-terminal cleavage/methylation domain-containing protein [Chloroflexi bacterium]|nr:prepilin-type N-terminal cleavage/methylation domain-containing protein [Chloroflexota bacterium]